MFELIAADDPRVEPLWRELEAHADPSYFLSWGWIENWLACLPKAERPELAVLVEGGAVVAACFVTARRVREHHLLPTSSVFVNATGIPAYDEVCIEHNGLLCARDVPRSLIELVELPGEWDELVMPGIDASELELLRAGGARVRVDREVPAPYVDLARARERPDGYLGVLGSAMRAHLRRARRRAGELAVDVAGDTAQALAIYDELVALHQASWQGRGQPGAFADPWFVEHHRRLIAQRFDHGELLLVRVRAKRRTLTCQYCFVYRGRVVYYQSGRAHTEDPQVSPGLLGHLAVIEHAIAAGHAVYDFLAGDADYKQHLATDENRIAWVRVQRPSVQFAIEERLRGWKHALGV